MNNNHLIKLCYFKLFLLNFSRVPVVFYKDKKCHVLSLFLVKLFTGTINISLAPVVTILYGLKYDILSREYTNN